MRQWIEYAVENYRSKNSFGFQLTKDLKPRQIDMAIEQYARIVKPEEVVALLDTTLVKSGKSGFLLTDRYLYSSNEKEEAPVELMYLKSVSTREDNNSYCVLEYEDGRKRELYVSVFLDVADILEMIISQRESQESEEEKESVKDDSSENEKEQAAKKKNEVMELERRVETSLDEIEDRQGTETNREITIREENTRKEPVIAVSEKEEETERDSEISEPEKSQETDSEETLSLEIIGLEDLEDKNSKKSEEPLWDTEALQEGQDVQEPYEQILEKAEAGDESAMYKAAEMLYTGCQAPQNQKEALRWFREAAKAAYVPAMIRLIQFYRDGEAVKKNLTLSMSWAKKAAATGEPEGKYALAQAYIYGEPEIQDTDKGLKLLVEMVQQGDAAADEMIREVHQKIREAKERFDKGIRNPSTASGYYEMGMYCKVGDGYYTYPKEAVEYFRKAAEKDHIQAQYQLALAYYTGAGVKKDEAESIRWLEKAASKSHKEAGELLTELQEKQRIKQEKTKFKSHLRQAEKGDAYAQSKVAGMYLRGIGVKKDIEKGIEWYEKASETDEGYAARQLAKLYADGDIIPADPERAAYWRMVGGILDDL